MIPYRKHFVAVALLIAAALAIPDSAFAQRGGVRSTGGGARSVGGGARSMGGGARSMGGARSIGGSRSASPSRSFSAPRSGGSRSAGRSSSFRSSPSRSFRGSSGSRSSSRSFGSRYSSGRAPVYRAPTRSSGGSSRSFGSSRGSSFGSSNLGRSSTPRSYQAPSYRSSTSTPRSSGSSYRSNTTRVVPRYRGTEVPPTSPGRSSVSSAPTSSRTSGFAQYRSRSTLATPTPGVSAAPPTRGGSVARVPGGGSVARTPGTSGGRGVGSAPGSSSGTYGTPGSASGYRSSGRYGTGAPGSSTGRPSGYSDLVRRRSAAPTEPDDLATALPRGTGGGASSGIARPGAGGGGSVAGPDRRSTGLGRSGGADLAAPRGSGSLGRRSALPAPGLRSLEPAGRSGASRDLAGGRANPNAIDSRGGGTRGRAVPSGGTPDYGDWKDGRVYTHGDRYYDYTGRYTGYRYPYYGGGCYYPYYHYYPYCWSWGYGPSWWWGYYCGWWPCYNWCWSSGCFYFGFSFYWPYYYCYGRYWPAYYAYWYPYDYGYYYGYTSYLPERVVVYESYPTTVIVEGGAEAPAVKEDPMAAGDVLLRAGDYEGAAAEYRKVVDAEPENSIAKFALADALFALGRYHEAAYMARLGLTQDPGWLDAVVNKGDLFKSLEEFDARLESLRARTSADAYDSATWFLLGYQLYFAGRYDESRAALDHCLTVLPGDRIVAAMLAKITEKSDPGGVAPPESEPAKSEVRSTEIVIEEEAAR